MNGSRMTAVAIGAAMMLMAMPAAADKVSIRPGLWETTTTMESSFMPAMPPRRTSECVREPDYDLDRMPSRQGDCRISDRSVAGNTLKWQMSCNTDGGATASGEGEMSSQGDRVEGHMTTMMELQGKRMDTKTSSTGRRLGDC